VIGKFILIQMKTTIFNRCIAKKVNIKTSHKYKSKRRRHLVKLESRKDLEDSFDVMRSEQSDLEWMQEMFILY